jgi:FKBP12-rapamycin complex-associated protein
MRKLAPAAEDMPLDSTFPNLLAIQKVDIFLQAIGASRSDDDLANILWMSSPNSEVWLHRRAAYVRTLAVMSMVGYVVGLGDRHPSNIMIHRYTGEVGPFPEHQRGPLYPFF